MCQWVVKNWFVLRPILYIEWWNGEYLPPLNRITQSSASPGWDSHRQEVPRLPQTLSSLSSASLLPSASSSSLLPSSSSSSSCSGAAEVAAGEWASFSRKGRARSHGRDTFQDRAPGTFFFLDVVFPPPFHFDLVFFVFVFFGFCFYLEAPGLDL